MNPYNPQIRSTVITPFDAAYLRSSLTGYLGRLEQTRPNAPALTVRRGLSWYCSFSTFAVPYNVVQAKRRFNLSYKNLIKVGIIPVLGPKIRQFWVSRRGCKLFPGPVALVRRAWTTSASPGRFAWSTRLAVEAVAPGQASWQTSYRLVAALSLAALASPGRPGRVAAP